jgi:hypothetical protein
MHDPVNLDDAAASSATRRAALRIRTAGGVPVP